jgi:predicted lipid-binding transport protein (Tim44 family)
MTKRGKRHPIKGAIAGLCLGLGLSLLLLIFSIWVVKDFTPYYILIGACVVIGILWGILAPARRRRRKGAPKAAAVPVAAAASPAAPAPASPPAPAAPAPAPAPSPAPDPGAPEAPGGPDARSAT